MDETTLSDKPTRAEYKQIKAFALAIAQLHNELSLMANDDGELTIKIGLLFTDLFYVLDKLGLTQLHLLKCFYSQYVNEFKEEINP